jgi:hypothetical protein
MFILNKDQPGLNITKVGDTEIQWLSNDFYETPEVVETYTSGARDSRIKPVHEFLSLFTGYSTVNDDIIDIRTRPYDIHFFDVDAYWNAIVCLDKEPNKRMTFHKRIEINQFLGEDEDGSEDNVPMWKYDIGEYVYTHPAEYNRLLIYNSKELHLSTDMDLFQVFHLRIKK